MILSNHYILFSIKLCCAANSKEIPPDKLTCHEENPPILPYSVKCKLCDGILAFENSKEDEDATSHGSFDNSKKKDTIVSHCEIKEHSFHSNCLPSNLENICPSCEMDSNEKIWLEIANFPPFYQNEYLKNLKIPNIRKLIRILEFFNRNDKMAVLKEIVLKSEEHNNFAKIIDIYEEEKNELCFLARIVTKNNFNIIIHYVSQESLSKLTLIQLLKVCSSSVFYSAVEDIESVKNFNIFASIILGTIDNGTIPVTKEELILFFEKILKFRIDHKIVEVLLTKLSNTPCLTIIEIYKLIILNFSDLFHNFDDCWEKIKILLNSGFKTADKLEEELEYILGLPSGNIIYDSLNDFIINYKLSRICYVKFSDETSFIDFVSKYSKNEKIYCRKSFTDFIAHQSNHNQYTDETIVKVIDVIFEREPFKLKFIDYLIIQENIVVLIRSFVIEKLLKCPRNDFIDQKIRDLFSKLKFYYLTTANLMFDKKLFCSLEEFNKVCIKDKHNCIRTLDDAQITLLIMFSVNELSYLGYYLLEGTDDNFTKKQISESEANKIIEKIFEDVNLNEPGAIKKVFNSIYNYPFLSFNITNFIIFALMRGITPQKFLDELGFDQNIDDDCLMLTILNGLLVSCKTKYNNSQLEYLKKVFSLKKDKLLNILLKEENNLEQNDFINMKGFLDQVNDPPDN